jgi:hypothetical protein
MIKKLLYLLGVSIMLFGFSGIKSQSLEGSYTVGDEKIEIRMDDYAFYVYRDGGNIVNSLKYEENTPENDQIWIERSNGKKFGIFVFQSHYNSGVFTNNSSGIESQVRKSD